MVSSKTLLSKIKNKLISIEYDLEVLDRANKYKTAGKTSIAGDVLNIEKRPKFPAEGFVNKGLADRWDNAILKFDKVNKAEDESQIKEQRGNFLNEANEAVSATKIQSLARGNMVRNQAAAKKAEEMQKAAAAEEEEAAKKRQVKKSTQQARLGDMIISEEDKRAAEARLKQIKTIEEDRKAAEAAGPPAAPRVPAPSAAAAAAAKEENDASKYSAYAQYGGTKKEKIAGQLQELDVLVNDIIKNNNFIKSDLMIYNVGKHNGMKNASCKMNFYDFEEIEDKVKSLIKQHNSLSEHMSILRDIILSENIATAELRDSIKNPKKKSSKEAQSKEAQSKEAQAEQTQAEQTQAEQTQAEQTQAEQTQAEQGQKDSDDTDSDTSDFSSSSDSSSDSESVSDFSSSDSD